MLLEALLNFVYWMFGFQFSIIPNVPPLPQPIIDSLNGYLDIALSGVGVVRYFIGDILFNAIIIVGIAILVFDYAYSIFLWAIRKIPFLGIK